MNDKSRIFFDGDLCVGKYAYKHGAQRWETADVVKEMKRTGIAGALAYHGLAKHYSPCYGNRCLIEEIKGHERLYPVFVLLPDGCGDFPTIDIFIEEVKKHNVKAVKMFPKLHQYPFCESTVGRQLHALEKEEIPLLLDWSQVDFGALMDVLSHHRNLHVLLQGAYWGDERALYTVMERFSRTYTDFTNLQSNEAVEYMCERFGAHRLMFGSNMPFQSPGAHRAFIDYARLEDYKKDQIAGGNLMKLVGISPKPQALPNQDRLMKQAATGQPIDVPVFDSHTHVLEDGGCHGTGRPMLRGDIDSMMRAYRAYGIDKMAVTAWLTIFADYEKGNEITTNAVTKYPQHVIGYAGIDPNYSKDVEADARYWHHERGLLGLKPFYNLSKIRYTDARYDKWWELAQNRRLFCLADPGGYAHGQYMQDIDELATRYPDISFFMDHGGRSFEVAEDYIKVASRHEHVYLQLTYTSVPWGMCEYLTEKIGAHKFMFGTDAPMRDPRQQLGWVVYADMKMEDKKQVLAENMHRVVSRCIR